METQTYTPEEQREHRKLWTAALRSGEYEQCAEFLCLEDRYCCLGVGCEIAILNGVELETEYKDGIKQYTDNRSGCVSEANLPITVRDWLGLAGRFGEHIGGSLSNLNDRKGYSFDQIADLVDSEPTGLIAEAAETGGAA